MIWMQKKNDKKEEPGKKPEAKKRKEKKGSRIPNRITKILPVRGYDAELKVFLMDDGSVMDIYRINSRDPGSRKESDIDSDIAAWSKFYRQCLFDIKIVSTNIPVDLSRQLQYTAKQKKQAGGGYAGYWLDRKEEELRWLEKNRSQKEFYLFVFSPTDAFCIQNRQAVRNTLMLQRAVSAIPFKDKAELLFRLCNKRVRVAEMVQEGLTEGEGVMEIIQPRGNVSFRMEDAVRTGKGYETCVEVYDFPPEIGLHWMRAVTDITDAIAVIDVGTEIREEIKKNLNASIKEQKIRSNTAKDSGDILDAERRKDELVELYRDIFNDNRVLKTVAIRVYLSAATKEELDSRVDKVIRQLDDFNSSVFLNEQYQEWLNLFLPYHRQQEAPFSRYGQPLIDDAVAIGEPFHFSRHSDPKGFYLGSTPSGGVVTFYNNTHTEHHTYYNTGVLGDMGSGKSTLLKKLTNDGIIRGDMVRIFDPMDEYRTLAEGAGGKRISLDGSEGMINPWEIMRTAEDDEQSYMNHVGKMTTIYRILMQTDDSQEISVFEACVRKLHEESGIMVPGRASAEYPTSSSFVKLLEKEIEDYAISDDPVRQELDKQELLFRTRILRNWRRICNNYASVLDGPTTIDDIMSVPVVAFNIKNVFSLPSEIADAVLYNAIVLCWDNCVQNGQRMKELYEEGEIHVEDIRFLNIVFDEFHRIVNGNKTVILKKINEQFREMRKLFGGFLYGTQSLREMVPKNTGSEAAGLINTLFDLTSTRFIGKQDENLIGLYRETFGASLTESELSRIPSLGMGEFILCSKGDDNCEVSVYVTDEELSMFKGGM